MREKMYALVGNWRAKDNKNGLVLCEYIPETGGLKEIRTYYENISVGNTCFDAERNIVYFVDEQITRTGDKTYGGGVLAASVDVENERLALISEVDSLSTNPSFVCVDKSRQYVLVPHHVSRYYVVRMVQDKVGKLTAKKKFDDAPLIVFRLEENGAIGEACDMFLAPDDGERCPHLHSLYADPTGELYIFCDKGLDKIYTFHLNREEGKLVHLYTAETAFDTWPRYGVFHPHKPFFYTNCEHSSLIYVWRYDVETGVLEKKQSIDLHRYEKGTKVMPSDITISGDGSTVYVSVRGTDEIAVLSIGEDSLLTPAQIVSSEGANPRGIAISPDGRFLLSANLESNAVATFIIRDGGCIEFSGQKSPVHSPGNILFLP